PSVEIMLDHPHPEGSTGLTEAVLTLKYDPKLLSVSASDITLGSIPQSGTGWQLNVVIDQATGQIGIELYSSTPITSNDAGSLVQINFHRLATRPLARTQVRLVAAVHPNGHYFGTMLADDQGALALTPGANQIELGSAEVRR